MTAAPRSHPTARLLIALSLAVTLMVTLLTASLPAAAQSGSTIVGKQSDRCLSVAGTKPAPRAPVELADCDSDADRWAVEGNVVRLDGTDMCLDVRGGDTTSPAAAQIYRCHGGDNQKWTITQDGAIAGVQSGLCLDVYRGRTAAGTKALMWTCKGSVNQRWSVTSADTNDEEDPTAPANPQVSGLTCDSVTFSWEAASDNVGVASYDVYRDGQFLTSVDGDTLSTELSVEPGVEWGLYVSAQDAAGNLSRASDTVTISPPPCEEDSEVPTAPTDLDGTATGTSARLTWTKASDNVGVTAYDVYRDGTRAGTVTGSGADGPVTAYTDSGLKPETTYEYAVRARDAQDNESEPSGSAEVTTGAACGEAVCGVTGVATDNDVPWGLATLPDGSVLYNRRDAHDIIRLDPETGRKTTLGSLSDKVEGTDGEGGLTGLAISPDFAEDNWLYLMYSSRVDNRIVRIKLEGEKLKTGTEQVLLSGIKRAKFHDGGRLRFGPDGMLYASTGDAENDGLAQKTSSLNGKILRLEPNGDVPGDNPFGNYVWSYGHRNPQGLAFDSQGRLWEQEFGHTRQDETNLIVKGGNYGWPACEGTAGDCDEPGFIAPKRTYKNEDASCSGIAIVKDAMYVACLRGKKMFRQVIDGTRLTNLETYFDGTYGRLRTVEPTGDGGLWLTTSTKGDKDSVPNNSDERILRVSLGR